MGAPTVVICQAIPTFMQLFQMEPPKRLLFKETTDGLFVAEPVRSVLTKWKCGGSKLELKCVIRPYKDHLNSITWQILSDCQSYNCQL